MNVLKLIEDHGLTLHGDIEHFAELVRADERERIIEKNKPEIEKVNAYIKDLEQAVLAEREACAKVCEDLIGTRAMARHCADAIRARGSEDGLR
jgi:hypothetical protein